MPAPENDVLLHFTRFLCGGEDYTVCYYSYRIQSTRSHQFAASIVCHSPIQLLFWYDGPRNYKCADAPDLEVFKELVTIWDDTKVLHGEMEKYVSIARRSGDKWFVGTMNAGLSCKLETKLDFLKPGVKYTADMADNGGQAIILTPIK